MITKTINSGIYEIEVQVKSIILGNTFVDSITGWDEIEATTLKLRCIDCTIMVFKKDMALFENISIGNSFKAIVTEWKKDIYNFKKMSE